MLFIDELVFGSSLTYRNKRVPTAWSKGQGILKVIISVVVLRLRLGLGLDGQVLVLEGLRVKSLDNSPG